MKLVKIPKNEYENYRLNVIFNGYKWDPMFIDHKTISNYALVLTKKEANEVINLTNKLALETILAQNMFKDNPKLAKPLKINRKIKKGLNLFNKETINHISLMRFDFHPTFDGWAVSEVNSDVPGGWAESTLMAQFANEIFLNKYSYFNFGDVFAKAIMDKTRSEGVVAFVHCTSYSDDRQVMQYMADKLENKGYKTLLLSADHIEFRDNLAYSILQGNEQKIDTIIRFNPIEWVLNIKKYKHKYGYFTTSTPSCNHPINFYTQTKRFPLSFDNLIKNGLNLDTWKALLPNTTTIKKAKKLADYNSYIFKPILGRVGEGISISNAISKREYKKIMLDKTLFKSKYIAQKRFDSLPLSTEDGDFHIGLGAFSVEGKFGGFYARMSKNPLINSTAGDLAVLIEE